MVAPLWHQWPPRYGSMLAEIAHIDAPRRGNAPAVFQQQPLHRPGLPDVAAWILSLLATLTLAERLALALSPMAPSPLLTALDRMADPPVGADASRNVSTNAQSTSACKLGGGRKS